MSKLVYLVAGLSVIILSFIGGYKFARDNSPHYADFLFAQEFDKLVVEELLKENQSYGYSTYIDASLSGPVIVYTQGEEVAVVSIREEIVSKVFSNDAKERLWENVRPLAHSIAVKILVFGS